MQKLALFIAFLALFAGGAWWFLWQGASQDNILPPVSLGVQGGNEAVKTFGDESDADNARSTSISELPSTGTGETASGSAAKEKWQPKVLTEEEQAFVTDTSDWMAKVRAISISIRKLHAETQGRPVELSEEERDVKKQYEVLRDMTDHIVLAPGHEEVRVLFEDVDATVAKAIGRLQSYSPTAEEYEAAIDDLKQLSKQSNELNRVLNEIRYE